MAFSRYQSCIKIQGQPILPPLLTDERRNEMQKYKDLAIEVEIKLNRSKERQLQNVSQTSDSEDCNEKVLNLLDDTFEQRNQVCRNQSFDDRDLISFDDDDDDNGHDHDSTTNNVNNVFSPTLEHINNNTDKENVITRQKTRKKKSYFSRKVPNRRSKKGTKNESNFDNTKEFEELALKGNIDEMFQKLQEIQLNQMLALNQKQQKEQKNLLKTLENDQIRLFKKLQKSFPDANKVETTDTSSPITTVVQTPNFDLNVSLSNQTLYLTTNSSFEENIGTAVYDNLSTSKDNIASMLLYDKPVSPEHFYLNDKQVWAANIINAYARGFLVRRLMRTNKVENIIKTLKDSLGCLRDLYCDDSSNLRQSDLLLSGRLMQQIEAACYSFYKIFFEITTSERLDIIRLDREIIREKQFKRMSKSLLDNRPSSSSTTTSRRSFRIRKPTVSDTCLIKNHSSVSKTYSSGQN